MSDEDELPVLIEAYRNSHSRQHVHRPYHLVTTQFDLDTDLEAQRVCKVLVFRKLDNDAIWPYAACCLPPRSRLSAHTFPSLPVAGRPPCNSLPVSILLLKRRNDLFFPGILQLLGRKRQFNKGRSGATPLVIGVSLCNPKVILLPGRQSTTQRKT